MSDWIMAPAALLRQAAAAHVIAVGLFMNSRQLRRQMKTTALAFRGYNQQNLGRSRELLLHPRYAPIVRAELQRASAVCRSELCRSVDLVRRVEENEETSLATYDEAIALIMAMEIAQLRILSEILDVDYRGAMSLVGYSLGELAALVAGGVFALEDVLRIPLRLAADCVTLAHQSSLGILFSRRGVLPLAEVERLCLEINAGGHGVIGVSTILAPNSVLLMGQGHTLQWFHQRMQQVVHPHAVLRINSDQWPPLHTAIMWERNVPNRAARHMHTLRGGFTAPQPPVLSLVTGEASYDSLNARDHLHRWVDHPQRLWDVTYQLLAAGVEILVHVGPAPNIIPATFRRLRDNVVQQTRASIGMRALSGMARRSWIMPLLPQRAAMLRAPDVQHIILEDWLLAQPG